MISETTIQRPVQDVWDFTDNPDNLEKWLRGFKRWELISGEPGKVGQVAHQHYEERGRNFFLKETILEMNPPYSSKLALSHKTMDSVVDMVFEEVSPGTTRVRCTCDIHFNGFWKLMGPLGRKQFQSRQDEDVERLKTAIESA